MNKLPEGKSYKRNDDDDMDVKQKKKQDQERREAKKQPVEEGKSFKRNRDEDADLKKKQDQERRDAKKQPMDESAQSLAELKKELADLEAEKIRCKGWDDFPTARHEGNARIAELKKLIAQKQVSEGKSFKRGKDDDDEMSASEKKKQDQERREAKKRPVEESKSFDIKKGAFHKWLGKSEDEKITSADIQKGLKSDDEHVRKMAQFAKNSRQWNESRTITKPTIFAENVEVGYYVEKDGKRVRGPMGESEAKAFAEKMGGDEKGYTVEYLSDYAIRRMTEGKSYKRNQDDDADLKKKDDKEKRELAKNKKTIKEDITPDTTPMSSVMEDLDSFYVIFKSPENTLYVHGKFASKEEAEEFKESKAVDYPEDRHGVFSYQNAKTLISKAQGPVDGLDAYPELCDQESCDQELDDSAEIGESSVQSGKTIQEAFGPKHIADVMGDINRLTTRYIGELMSEANASMNEDLIEYVMMTVVGRLRNSIKGCYSVLGGGVTESQELDEAKNDATTKNMRQVMAVSRNALSKLETLVGSKFPYDMQSEPDEHQNFGGDKQLRKLVLNAMTALERVQNEVGHAVMYREESDEIAEDQELDEAYRGDWAILPATMALYGKRVVDIKTAASTWADSNYETSILVCTKKDNGRERVLFVSSSGNAIGSYQIGKTYSTFHDQTGASKGDYTVRNIVVFKNGEIVDKVNDFGLNVKASLSVFK